MKMNLTKNWIAKILSLLLAIAIWFLINEHLKRGGAVAPVRPFGAPVAPEPDQP